MTQRLYTTDQETEIVELRQAGMPIQELVEKFGGTRRTMQNYLHRHGVKGRIKPQFTAAQMTKMEAMWHAGKSQREIGEAFGLTQFYVSTLFAKAKVARPAVRANILRGEKVGTWKGGRIQHISGYTAISIPEDSPYRSMAFSKGGYVLEHRLVMAQHIGRPLTKTENVHHRNGKRDDNRIENLELWITRQPKGQRVTELVDWAREILSLYGDLVDRMTLAPA